MNNKNNKILKNCKKYNNQIKCYNKLLMNKIKIYKIYNYKNKLKYNHYKI